MGPPSDPRLRRALGILAQGCPSPESALQASPRRRLRRGHDPTAQATAVGEVRKAASDGGPDGTAPCGLSRMPVSKRGSVEQACLQNGDLRSSPGRRMPDGRDSVRVRRCRNRHETTTTATARSWVSCGSWLPSDLLRTQAWWGDTPGMSWLLAVPGVERATTVHAPLVPARDAAGSRAVLIRGSQEKRSMPGGDLHNYRHAPQEGPCL